MADDKRRLPVQKTLPMQWRSGDNVINDRAVVRPDGPIAEVSDRDVLAFANQNARTCGSCKFLRPKDRDRPEVKGFVAAAIHEAKWRMGWLAPDPQDLRRCGMNEGLAVAPTSAACDQYREGRGGIR